MSVRWRAVYEDGSTYEGAYGELERSRVRRFQVFASALDLAPILDIEVPEGSRLVHRTRWVDLQRMLPVVLVALESPDRSEVDLHVLRDDGAGVLRWRQSGYGIDAATRPPELLDCEV